VGAGARGEFRHEDAMCCARVARQLIEAGFEPEDDATEIVLRDWSHRPLGAVAIGASANYLRETGRDADIAFVLGHVDDVDGWVELVDAELVLRRPGAGGPGVGAGA
jgi:2-phosphosulfolactate phosphatase